MKENRFKEGDLVILDDGTLAIITGVYLAYNEYWYEVETRGQDMAMRRSFEVSRNEIQGKA